MKKIWLTYAWTDNENLDVDYVRQQIVSRGVDVKIDRWHVPAGLSLWRGIESGICDQNCSDAWAIYITENCLRRPTVREELDWALNRAISARGAAYPLIGIFPGPISEDALPAPIRVRRYVSLVDPTWCEIVVAAASGRPPDPSPNNIAATYWKWHQANGKVVLELRPRAGVWNNFLVLVPDCDREKLRWVSFGAPDMPYKAPYMESKDENWMLNGQKWSGLGFPGAQPSPTRSVFIELAAKPNALLAAIHGREAPTARYVLQPDGKEQAF